MNGNVASGLLERWDLDRVQLAALREIQRRAGRGVTDSMPADGRPRSRWRVAAPFYFKLAMYAFVGLAGAAGILFPSFFHGMAFSYTLIMMLVGLALLNYFTTVLLDTSENRILLHLPISGRTLLAARIFCIAKYAGLLTLAISLPTAVALAARFGIVALLVFTISLVLTLVLVINVALAVCLVALRYVKPALIRYGVFYTQTALITFIVWAGTAVINSPVPLAERLPEVNGATWWYFYPPAWMAGLLDFFVAEKTRFNGILAAIAVLAPLAGFAGCIRLFAGGRFTVLLARLDHVPRHRASRQKSGRSLLAGISGRVSEFLIGDRQQRAAFDLSLNLMKRDLGFSLGAYTYIGGLLLYLGTFVAQHHAQRLQDLPMSVAFSLYAIFYIPLLPAIKTPRNLQYSAEWRAAWCYAVLPFAKPGVIVSGAMKAYVWKYVLPVYLLVAVVCAAVWEAALALDVLYASAAVMLVCVIGFWSAARRLPFSRERTPDVVEGDGRLSLAVFMAISGGLILLQIVLKSLAGRWGVALGIVLVGAAIAVAYRKLQFMSSTEVGAPDRHVGWHSSGH